MLDDTRSATVLAAAPGRVLHSDPHDFAGLYVRHRSSLTMHARRHLNDVRDADEVVQEAFLRLFLALPELDTELQALAYCRRTITNLCIDRYRAAARRPDLVDLESVPQETFADQETGDPVIRAEDAALIREALSRLPELHRAALVKREIEEKPLPVIADELDIPEDNVKHLLFRARRALRKLLASTSLAPGVDAERGRALPGVPRVRSGGLAGLLVLLAIGLGSGPDLEAVPVVGVDLPDVIGVTRLADAIGEAVTDVVDRVTTDEPSEAATVGRTNPSPVELSDPSSSGSGESGVPAGAAQEPVTGRASGADAPTAPASTTAVPPAGAASSDALRPQDTSGGAASAPTLPVEQLPAAVAGSEPARATAAVPGAREDGPRRTGHGTADRPAAEEKSPVVGTGRDASPVKPAREQVKAPATRPAERSADGLAARTEAHARVQVKREARAPSKLDVPGAAAARTGAAPAAAAPATDDAKAAAAAARAETAAAKPAARAEAAAAKAEAKQARIEPDVARKSPKAPPVQVTPPAPDAVEPAVVLP